MAPRERCSSCCKRVKRRDFYRSRSGFMWGNWEQVTASYCNWHGVQRGHGEAMTILPEGYTERYSWWDHRSRMWWALHCEECGGWARIAARRNQWDSDSSE